MLLLLWGCGPSAPSGGSSTDTSPGSSGTGGETSAGYDPCRSPPVVSQALLRGCGEDSRGCITEDDRVGTGIADGAPFVGDFDGDGSREIVTIGDTKAQVYPGGDLDAPISIDLPVAVRTAASFDEDRDGTHDIAYTGEFDAAEGAGEWGTIRLDSEAEAADVTNWLLPGLDARKVAPWRGGANEGDLVALVGVDMDTAGSRLLLARTTTGEVVQDQILSFTAGPETLVTGDVTGDGSAEAFVGGESGIAVAYGAESDLSAVSEFTTDPMRDLAIGDADGDGELDLVGVRAVQDQISVFRGGRVEDRLDIPLATPTSLCSEVDLSDVTPFGDRRVDFARVSGMESDALVFTFSYRTDCTPAVYTTALYVFAESSPWGVTLSEPKDFDHAQHVSGVASLDKPDGQRVFLGLRDYRVAGELVSLKPWDE